MAPILPVSPLTELRFMVGTAALVGVATVLAFAIGALARIFLAFANLVPDALVPMAAAVHACCWIYDPAEHPTVARGLGRYTPQNRYYPLVPGVGLAVLCGYAALALALAIFLPRRRDHRQQGPHIPSLKRRGDKGDSQGTCSLEMRPTGANLSWSSLVSGYSIMMKGTRKATPYARKKR